MGGFNAIKMAAAFAYLSVNEMDKVSIYAIHGDRVDEVISGIVGKDSYYNYINKLNEIEFTDDVSISQAILSSVKIGMGDGYSILISDFLTDEDYERAIDRFAERKRDILCLQILSREEINPQMRGKMHLFDAENALNFFRKRIDKDRIEAYKAALQHVVERIKNVSKILSIPFENYAPEDSKGIKHLLGVFECETKGNRQYTYDKFITQGAKKYAYMRNEKNKETGEVSEKISITVAGVPKSGSKCLKRLEDFKDDLVFDYETTHKQMLMYNDEQPEIMLEDYQGHIVKVDEKYYGIPYNAYVTGMIYNIELLLCN